MLSAVLLDGAPSQDRPSRLPSLPWQGPRSVDGQLEGFFGLIFITFSEFSMKIAHAVAFLCYNFRRTVYLRALKI